MNVKLSTYFLDNVPLDVNMQLFKTDNFPRPPAEYKPQNLTEQLHPFLRVTLPVTKLLNKKELAAEETYVEDLRNWVADTISVIKARHTRELDMTQKQLQTLMNKTHLTNMEKRDIKRKKKQC